MIREWCGCVHGTLSYIERDDLKKRDRNGQQAMALLKAKGGRRRFLANVCCHLLLSELSGSCVSRNVKQGNMARVFSDAYRLVFPPRVEQGTEGSVFLIKGEDMLSSEWLNAWVAGSCFKPTSERFTFILDMVLLWPNSRSGLIVALAGLCKSLWPDVILFFLDHAGHFLYINIFNR